MQNGYLLFGLKTSVLYPSLFCLIVREWSLWSVGGSKGSSPSQLTVAPRLRVSVLLISLTNQPGFIETVF